jgi:hypothetical protein
MKLTGKQRKELKWKVSECLQDEMIDIHGDELGWWSMPDDVERVTNKIIEAIELD